MTKLMDLKVDFAFKQLFGKVGNEPILLAFLNAALQSTQGRRILSVEILNPEMQREHIEDKMSVLDIHARTEHGEHINIEIQLANKFDMEKRTLYYWSRIYAAQMQKGKPYTELSRTITINIINFHYLPQTERYHTTFHLYEDYEHFVLTDLLEVHFMEMPKLMEKWRQGTINLHEDALERWLMLLEASDHEEIRKALEAIAMKDPVMKQAFEEWEDMSRDMKKWAEYESRRKAILDEMAAIIEARERGFAEGRAEGQAVGREEGRAEGLAEGERQKAIEIAKEMLAEGDSVERVARLTKLSLEEVEKLKQQLH